ncbi:Hypothetical predicted protein [Mytilus galloprovincialis]|uniref:Uncharacterized protein n=1 Tax=Mytilus galloprovincialis TaxID=29158 RepID=A0A8B6HME5_MYTGA|nr:Hypothetical predicted protein [Mytilus galloprovincialis]
MSEKKDELNKLVAAENVKYHKENQNILSHKKTVKEQVEQYFKELKNKLEKNHETVLTSVKSDLNAISLFTTQKEDKINEVQTVLTFPMPLSFSKRSRRWRNSLKPKNHEPGLAILLHQNLFQEI